MCVTDNPSQIASVSIAVRILDVNDNPPSLTHYLEAYLCENTKAGQVRGYREYGGSRRRLRVKTWQQNAPTAATFSL